ncbi:O-antigen ligase family protein [Rufibacter roseus]|uniref:O-antigen ligase family protein n=1 Tax=Rufibacter roseus TaxID=1567108 RepID=A0ABW2DSR6_9BACT|nr:O-antigen ligase family protein [Rufibacter roseus]
MQISISKIIFYLFLLLPLSFKIEPVEGVAVYPQELLFPVLIVLSVMGGYKKILPESKPFQFYFVAFAVVLVATILSQLHTPDLSGLLKVIKYLLYLTSILLLSNYNFENFLSKFNTVGFLCIVSSILLYLYKFLIFEGTASEFVGLTTWNTDYTPSGYSNLVYQVYSGEFERTTGNHGIYGSYLILIYILNLAKVLEGKSKLINKSLVVLALSNLLLINSREALMVFIIVNFLYFTKPLLKLKLKISYIIIFAVIILGMVALVMYDVNIGMVQKVQYTIESFNEKGSENNISLRFRVWHLILLSFTLYPLSLLFGTGYNLPIFEKHLTNTNAHYQLYNDFVTVPESMFLFFLSFGGILAFIFILLFFLSAVVEVYKLENKSITTELFFITFLGLILANNTGGSLMSDLLLAQFSLVYLWIVKKYGTKKDLAPNR